MTDLPRIVAFDLDDTLAPSKSRMRPEMTDLIARLLSRTQVAIISGGRFQQFQTQVLHPLADAGVLAITNLHILPTCGAQYFRHAPHGWERLYIEQLTADERERISVAVEVAARSLDYWAEFTWGAAIEDRESQITYSALGQDAPIDIKAAWDPMGVRKRRLRDAIETLLPDLEIRAGGSTSIDITRRGRDKSHGMRRLLAETGSELSDVLFFGDQLGPGGNDRPVFEMGIPSVEVSSWAETVDLITALLDGRTPPLYETVSPNTKATG